MQTVSLISLKVNITI